MAYEDGYGELVMACGVFIIGEGVRKKEGCFRVIGNILLKPSSGLLQFLRCTEICITSCTSAAFFAHEIGVSHKPLIIFYIGIEIADILKQAQVFFMF